MRVSTQHPARPAVKREIVNIRNKVYVATGYDVANMAMIVGDDGVLFVDSGASPKAASALTAEFRNISDKPLKAVLLTHSHPDHRGGLPGIVGMEQKLHPGFDPAALELWARDNWGTEDGVAALLPDIFRKRTLRQMGAALTPAQRGASPLPPYPGESEDGSDWPVAPGEFKPNRLVPREGAHPRLAGIELDLRAAPGETSDHMFLWMPEERVAFAGDNIFHTFPNLYAIRGVPYRDVAAWAESLLMMYELHPACLVMGHSAPLTDPSLCDAWLRDHHDAVLSVYEATLAGMNKGWSPDDLAQRVTLPGHLAKKDYLKEFYGNVAWSVRGIYDGHLGWFDGEARKLTPLSPQGEAERMLDMAGGIEGLLARAQQALKLEDAAWAAQLVSYLLRLQPAHTQARSILADALEMMAEDVLSSTGRCYMLSCAKELRG